MDIAINTSTYVSSPEFAGWLLKRGFKWRKLWKKRWVALHGCELVYMEDEPDPDDPTKDIAMTKALITANTLIDETDVDGHEFGFTIHINDGKSQTWQLRAESKEDR